MTISNTPKMDRTQDPDFFHPAAPPVTPDLVSVIVPTYNRKDLILDALKSVLAQPYRPMEAVVADDGSNDGTRDLIRAFCGAIDDPGFFLTYAYQENHGVSAARNLGFRKSSGQFIIFLDSDDYLKDQWLSRIVTLAKKKPGFEVAVCGYELVHADKSFKRYHSPGKPCQLYQWRDLGRRVREIDIWTSSKIYSRALVEKVGPWREGLVNGEDLEFSLRVAIKMNPDNALIFPDPIACYREHDQPRLTQNAILMDRKIALANAMLPIIQNDLGNDAIYYRYLSDHLVRFLTETPHWDLKFLKLIRGLSLKWRRRMKLRILGLARLLFRGRADSYVLRAFWPQFSGEKIDFQQDRWNVAGDMHA